MELENGIRFLTNLKYTLKEEISKDPMNEEPNKFSEIKTGDYAKFDSHCDQTMVGFVQTIPTIKKERYSMANHKI